jgi:hypothetical protein
MQELNVWITCGMYLTQEQWYELVGYLEFDFDRFPAHFNKRDPHGGLYSWHFGYEDEVWLWIDRSEDINEFMNRFFKIKQ